MENSHSESIVTYNKTEMTLCLTLSPHQNSKHCYRKNSSWDEIKMCKAP